MEFGMRFRRADAGMKVNARFWHDVEGMPLDEVRKIQERKLVEQMAYLKANSSFYQDKFAEAGVEFDEIRTIEDLQKLPFTYKTEIRESLSAEPPFGRHRAAPVADITQMQASSGTTGSPSYVALTESDAEMWHEMSARCFFANGVRPGDMVLHAFSLAKGFVGGIPLMQGLQYMGAIDVPIGADGGVDRLLRACADIRPRCIAGAPNFVIHLAEKAEEMLGAPASRLGVERVVVGGEPGGGIPAIRTKIEKLWGAKCTEMLGGTDLGVTYWAECDEQSGMHMVNMDYIITELLHPDTGEILAWEDGAKGEMIYTALGRRASPLVRFRSGDFIEVLGTTCSCGRTGPKIRCTGRTDDMLIVRGANVFPSAINSVVNEMVPETNGVMRVVADFEGHTTQEPLKIIVERGPARKPEGDPTLKKKIEQRMRDALVFKADVRIVDPDTFEKPGAAKVAFVLRKYPDLP
ncbi:phenylacetate--CoA ligase family protein [uncultured Bradyrhizobium sp.]|uniref:phenylacetate--CoA ligase family protein n=1 Tax=Bradyrhizobium sp. TaxID=376 RepID=UPI00262555B8|nr:phenylacetate--CoA ligase family protein [uncultured Bradyrhizobium sp.]